MDGSASFVFSPCPSSVFFSLTMSFAGGVAGVAGAGAGGGEGAGFFSTFFGIASAATFAARVGFGDASASAGSGPNRRVASYAHAARPAPTATDCHDIPAGGSGGDEEEEEEEEEDIARRRDGGGGRCRHRHGTRWAAAAPRAFDALAAACSARRAAWRSDIARAAATATAKRRGARVSVCRSRRASSRFQRPRSRGESTAQRHVKFIQCDERVSR